jgi:hypothetical protein
MACVIQAVAAAWRLNCLRHTSHKQFDGASLANLPQHSENLSMQGISQTGVRPSGSAIPFHPGTMVVATLGNPREKFWGTVLALAPEGISLCGVELASFEDLVTMVKEGEAFTASVIFFPMHRVERVELDLPDGSIPSLSQRFTSKTGLAPATVLTAHGADHLHPGEAPE